MVVGSVPCFHVRCERGTGAGPLSTVPSRWKREPWHGQSNDLSFAFNATEQPRCEQLMAKTETLPLFLTAKPANASSPAALSPPPSAMMKAELGLAGALNLSASPSLSWSIGLSPGTATIPSFSPLGGRRPEIDEERSNRRDRYRRHQGRHPPSEEGATGDAFRRRSVCHQAQMLSPRWA